MVEARYEILSKVAAALTATIKGQNRGKTTIFDSSSIPGISVHDYVLRLANYFKCSESCHILALLYLDRFVHKTSTRLTNSNVHRLYLTALVVGTKYWDDPFYTNTHYASGGGVRLHEINKLELYFLQQVHWDLYVKPEQFKVYKNVVEKVEVESKVSSNDADAVSTTAGETSCSSPEAKPESESECSQADQFEEPDSSDYENENEVVDELYSFNRIYHKGSWDHDEGSTTVGDDLSVYYADDMSVFSEDVEELQHEQKHTGRGQPKRRSSRMRHLKPKPHVIWSNTARYQLYRR